jgi:hypothetical protein
VEEGLAATLAAYVALFPIAIAGGLAVLSALLFLLAPVSQHSMEGREELSPKESIFLPK